MLNQKIKQYHKAFPDAPILIFGLGSSYIPEEVKIRLIDKALRLRCPICNFDLLSEERFEEFELSNS